MKKNNYFRRRILNMDDTMWAFIDNSWENFSVCDYAHPHYYVKHILIDAAKWFLKNYFESGSDENTMKVIYKIMYDKFADKLEWHWYDNHDDC